MKKRLLIVVSEFPPGPGGIGNHAYSLAKHLVKEGCLVDVVADSNYADEKEVMLFDANLPQGLVIKRIERNGWRTYLNRYQTVAKLLKTVTYTGVYLSGKFSLWLGGWFKGAHANVPFIGVLHGSEVQIKDLLHGKLTNWGIGKCDKLLPVSSFTHSLLNDTLKKRPFAVVPNGIDLSEFAQLELMGEQSEFKITGNPSILTVGNVTPRKGQHRVIKAMPDILEKYPEAHYHIVGLPSFKEPFLKLAKELGVEKSITFHGRLPSRGDLAAAYKQADCFMILSENQQDGDVEGFGIVILEANYFGLPAIGASGCGIADAINSDTNGFLVDGDVPQQIVNALTLVLTNKTRLAEGAKMWAQQHDWNSIVHKYLKEV